MQTIKEFQADKLFVKVYENRGDLGKASAKEMAVVLKKLLFEKNEVNIIFAAAPSQNEFLEALIGTKGIDWNRVNAFHLDEYIGIGQDAPQGFGNFLRDRIFGKVPMKIVNYINGNASDPEKESARYAALLKQFPPDIVCMGIGENGHIAFNDPHIAQFNDDLLAKVVELDEKCRNQQVNDGCFMRFEDVPTHALTLTIPALFSSKYLFCMVPGRLKANAVERAISGEVNESCPASILRTHDQAVLYIDRDSASELKTTNGN